MSDTHEQDVDAIRDDIDQTRVDMSQTLDQIQERLAPDALKAQAQGTVQDITEQVLEEVRAKASDLTSSLTEQINAAVHSATAAKTDQVLTQAGDTARQAGASLWSRMSQNPAPVALAALGIGIAASQLMRDDSPASQPNGASAQGGAGTSGQSAKETASGMAGTAQAKAGEAVDGAKQGASHLMEQAQGGIDQVKQALPGMPGKESMPSSPKGFLQEQPLAAGALAIGLGLVLGLGLPETKAEEEALAPVRDQVADGLAQAAGSGKGLMDQAKQAAMDVTAQAKGAAAGLAQESKDAAKDVGQTAKSSGKQAVKDHGLAG